MKGTNKAALKAWEKAKRAEFAARVASGRVRLAQEIGAKKRAAKAGKLERRAPKKRRPPAPKKRRAAPKKRRAAPKRAKRRTAKRGPGGRFLPRKR